MKHLLKRIPAFPLASAVAFGILLFIALSLHSNATVLDHRDQVQDFGFHASNGAADIAIHYLDGSETVALTLRENRETNYKFLCAPMYETASDVWTYKVADVTLKDSDSNGYIDWLGFTATGGDTAGGEVRIHGIAISTGSVPGI